MLQLVQVLLLVGLLAVKPLFSMDVGDANQPLRVVLNELHFEGTSFFIEMKKVAGTFKRQRKETAVLKDYQIVILQDGPSGLDTVLTAYLGEPAMNFLPENTYWVFGKSTGSVYINVRNALSGSVRAFPSPAEFKFEEQVPYAFLLMRSSNMGKLKLFWLDSDADDAWKIRNWNIDDNMLQTVSEVTEDIIIGCYKQPCRKASTALELMLKTLNDKKHLTLSSEPAIIMKSYSLNLCTSDGPFSYDSFHHGSPTPGSVNDCSAAFQTAHDCSELMDTEAAISDADAIKLYAKEFACEAEKQLPDVEIVNQQLMTTQQEIQLQKILESWQPIVPSTSEMDACSKYFSNPESTIRAPHVKNWIGLQPIPRTCLFFCQACQLFAKLQRRPDFRPLPDLALTGATASTIAIRNDQKIKRHLISAFHKTSSVFFNNVRTKQSIESRMQSVRNYEQQQYRFYLPTIRFVFLSYVQIVSGIPFKAHPGFMEAMTKTHVDVGIIHRNIRSVVLVAEVYGEHLHDDLVTQIVRNENFFSLILDSSTDVSNTPLLSCSILTVVGGKTTVKFYGLLKVKRENAEQIFSSIITSIQKDGSKIQGFESKFKEKLVSLATDNAAVFTGSTNSVFTKFQEYTGRKIVQQRCMNHGLELAFQAALKLDESDDLEENDATTYQYIQSLYKKSNQFHKFFQSVGSRRHDHFRETCVEYEMDCKRFKKYLDIRWCASHYEVLLAVDYNLKPAVKDLEKYRTERDVTDKTKAAAQALLELASSTVYAVTLSDQLDILEIFKRTSLKLQRQGILLVDVLDIIEKTMSELLELKVHPGVKLQRFLDTCRCERVCEECSLEQVEECTSPVCDGLKLHRSSHKLAQVRVTIVDNLVYHLTNRFKPSELEVLQALDFRREKVGTRSRTLSQDRLKKFELVLGAVGLAQGSAKDLQREYELFVAAEGNKLTSQSFTSMSEMLFWVLEHTNVPDLLQNILRRVLVIPASSAEAERSFSYVNMYKTRHRNLMTTNVLNHLLGVKINGPPLKVFNAYDVGKLFVMSHKRVDVRYTLKSQVSSEMTETAEDVYDESESRDDDEEGADYD